MYKVVATWSAPRPSDVEAFEGHYRETHVPLALAVPHLRKLRLTRTDRGLEGAAPAFYRVAELLFDSPESLAESSHSAAWQSMREDAGRMIERFGTSLAVAIGWEEEPRR